MRTIRKFRAALAVVAITLTASACSSGEPAVQFAEQQQESESPSVFRATKFAVPLQSGKTVDCYFTAGGSQYYNASELKCAWGEESIFDELETSRVQASTEIRGNIQMDCVTYRYIFECDFDALKNPSS